MRQSVGSLFRAMTAPYIALVQIALGEQHIYFNSDAPTFTFNCQQKTCNTTSECENRKEEKVAVIIWNMFNVDHGQEPILIQSHEPTGSVL